MNLPSLDRLKSELLPPHSIEAERGVIGCILWDAKECIPLCVESFAGIEAPFYDLRNETVFKTCCELADDGAPVDLISLQAKLKASGHLEQVGGLAGLSELQDQVPSAANLGYYLEVVKECALRRAAIKTCQHFITEAHGTKPTDELIDGLERDVLAIRPTSSSGQKTVKELVKESVAKIQTIYETAGAISGISTGLEDVDRETDGLQPGELVVIGGYPSTGKTSLAMNLVEHVSIKLGIPSLVFSLEMPGEALVRRAIFSVSRVSKENVKHQRLSPDDFKAMAAAQSKISSAPLVIRAESDLSVDTMRAMARRIKQQHDTKLIVVDYLQKLNAKGKRKETNQAEELGLISSACKACAMELDVAFILLTQLNDEGKVFGSRVPFMDTDSFWEIQNDGDWLKDNQPIKLTLKKNRNGEAGTVIPLLFRKSITRFECVAKVNESDIP